MKKFLVAMGLAAFAFVGCDDSSSVSAGQNDEPSVESSSSSGGEVTEPAEVTSSSSGKAKSSSSDTQSDAKQSSSSEKTGKSSSSVDDASSSSVKPESSENSSSSKVPEPAEGSSSSDKTSVSSSSSADVLSSSSEPVEISSSSDGEGTSSSSSTSEINCSVLLEGETGWSWDVPKECRFNPDIDYGSMTDSRDGKVYRTVTIGKQTWMAENLNYYDASDLNVKEKSWCYGKKDNGDSTTCDMAGRLYTWAAAIDSVKLANDADNPQDCGYGKECGVASTRSATLVQGVCPTGWHLPSKTEWNALFTAVGDESTAGKVLKSQTGWYNRGNGTDAFGFSALPAGGRNGDEDYYNEGDYAYFWSSTELNSSYAYRMYLDYGSVSATLSFKNKDDGFSVRCVKD